MTLFPDEHIVLESNDKSVVLTTHRIYYNQTAWGSASSTSIMLENITSCETKYSANNFLLIVGGGAILLLQNGLGLILGLALAVAYFLTRKQEIKIGSSSSKIAFSVNGMSRESVMNFIDTLERTKNKRLLQLNKISY